MMNRVCREAGFGLVELLVALTLLSTIALALTSTIVTCHQARNRNERWMRATTLAAEGLEQLRAGQALSTIPQPTIFARRGNNQGLGGLPGLRRIDVSVSWNDGQDQTLQLSALAYTTAAAAH